MKLIHGDCLTEMERMGDSSVDAVVCDLPYFKVVGAGFDNQWRDKQEYLEWVWRLLTGIDKVLKPEGNVFLFTSRQYNRHICLMMDRLFHERRIIVWCRKRSFNGTRGKALASGYEPIAYYCKGLKGTFNCLKVKSSVKRKEYTEGRLKDGITLSDVWDDIPALPHNAREKTPHPTQKPLALMERIVAMGTNPGDTVLDCCMGSGTTGIACSDLGRDFIGIEKDKAFFDVCVERCRGRGIEQLEIEEGI
ncbi:MAG: site-specific DNA-methyltransferase [Clostridia bacterium]|nr:site-specific DNA-methyltransferase [Clostridia bacterium]